MRLKITALICMAGVTFVAAFSARGASSVVGSKHDLSTSSTNEPCAFCHTPHFANSGNLSSVPLWNRGGSGATFTMYASTTIDTTIPGTPSAVSLACLGCHDGVASPLGDGINDNKHGILNAPGPGGMPDTTSYPNCAKCHPNLYGSGPAVNWIGTDLRKSHPVSMVYPTSQQDPAFFTPPSLQKGWSDVPLYSGKVECPTCHNVHDPSKTPFLRIANTGSVLCYKCHNK